jgi:hypothetical protein
MQVNMFAVDEGDELSDGISDEIHDGQSMWIGCCQRCAYGVWCA